MARALPPVWLSSPGRFAGIARRPATWIAVAFAILILLSFAALSVVDTPDASRAVDQMGDLALYDGVIDGVRAGGNYYQLLADGLRAGGYPLRPFVTFRLPTHAVIQAALPLAASLALLWLLAIGVCAVWWMRLRPALARTPPRIAAMILLAGGMVAFIQVELIGFHEIWAAQLVALSLALRRPGRWVEAAALALIAMLVRETAALYVIVMAMIAWAEGDRREVGGWMAALGLFAAAVAAHAYGVGRVTGPLDPASPGWNGFLGFGFFVQSVVASTALRSLPMVIAAPIVTLALIGWASWRDPLALRVVTTLAGYAVAIGIFARADTFYWALMVAPLLLVGLAFAPDALRDLGHAILDRRRIRVQRITQ